MVVWILALTFLLAIEAVLTANGFDKQLVVKINKQPILHYTVSHTDTHQVLRSYQQVLADDYAWLLNQTSQLLRGCRLVNYNGTILFTPDAVQGYGAQWTRDFAYAVQNTPSMLWVGILRSL